MHRHGKILPAFRSHSTSRSSSTAAKLKPREFTSVSESSGPQSSSNLREQSQLGSRSPSSLFRPLSSRFQPPSEAQPLSAPTRNWASPNPAPSSSQALSGPQRLRVSPSPNSLSKWARTAPPSPPPSVVSSTQPSSSSHPFGQGTGQLSGLKRQSPPHRASLEQASLQSGRLQGSYSRKHPDIQGTKTFNSKNPRLSQERLARPTDQPGPGSKRDSRSLGFTYNTPEQSRPSKDQFRNARLSRNAFKERGSLVLNRESNTFTPSRSRETLPRKIPSVQKTKSKFAAERGPIDVYIPSTVSVGTLARLLKIKLPQLQRKMRKSGLVNEAAYDHVLTSDYAALLVEEFGRNPIVDDEAAFDLHPPPAISHSERLPPRPPIVTIMGHVDHGKTTLLDTLRSASVAKSEAGGITQHIGAFSVPVNGGNTDGPQSITFLDTPGHAAFSAMRARGAGVTDIVVLVVAADDGIMPQTREVIELIKQDQGKMGLVVAINKVDKPDADVDSVQRALLAEGIQLEAFGGDIPSVQVSGLTGQGLPDLVETLSAVAEMQDLSAETDGKSFGHVLESKVQKGLGPVATVLVLRGSLKIGAHVIGGLSQAKVRLMSDSAGATVKVATPGMAVIVSGWKTLPKAGDEVIEASEADVKKALANRIRKADMEAVLSDVDAINETRRQDRERRKEEVDTKQKTSLFQDTITGPKPLRIIIKADVSGSAEALEGALQCIGNKVAATKILSSGVGDISESDVMIAKASEATIVGFSVSASRSIETLAAQNGVPICTSNIIYRLVEDIRARVTALLPVIIETKVTGEATVLQLFDIQLKAKQTKKIAGCRVTNGLVEKSKFARVVRGGVMIHEGSLDTLRQLKKDVVEVRKGIECGLCFCDFTDIREGDLIQMYEKIEKPGVL